MCVCGGGGEGGEGRGEEPEGCHKNNSNIFLTCAIQPFVQYNNTSLILEKEIHLSAFDK